MSLDDRLTKLLTKKRSNNLYRSRIVRQQAQGAFLYINHRKYLNFCSNDYLGLASHPAVISATKNALDEYGVGSGASALITGYTDIHQKLEEALCEFTNRSKVLLFNSGFAANTSTIHALVKKDDTLIMDRLCHASLIDGGGLATAGLSRYRHCDTEDLEHRLKMSSRDKDSDQLNWVISESLFSMDGDLAPLDELSNLCEKYSACLYIDDAHAFGVYGENGSGSVCASGLNEQQVPVMMATFGKALGTSGAFIAGSESLIETLIQTARSYIYTTAMPPALAAATLKSLELVRSENWRREKLFELIQYFREKALNSGYPVAEHAKGPIQPINIGDNEKVMKLSHALADQGIKISAIRPPTVPAGSARLRLTISAAHEKEHIDLLIETLQKLMSSKR